MQELETSNTYKETFDYSQLDVYNTEDTLMAVHKSDNLDGQVMLMMEKLEGNKWACITCGKKDRKANIGAHVESAHIDGIIHTCKQCGKISRSKDALRKHIVKYHKC